MQSLWTASAKTFLSRTVLEQTADKICLASNSGNIIKGSVFKQTVDKICLAPNSAIVRVFKEVK